MYGTFTLTGRHTTPSGKAHAGSVVVTPNATIRDTAGDVVMSGAEQVKLDETGAWSIVLPCDSPDLNPSEGIGYTVGFSLYSTSMTRQSFYATADMAGSTLDVSEIVSVSVPAPLSAIVGPQGEPGPAGADGADGAQGLQGIKGDKGDTGPQLPVEVARRPLRVFASDFEETFPGSGILRDWTTGHTGTASSTIAASTRQDGGNTVTLIPAASSIALIKTKAFHGYADRPQWFTTDEMTVPTGRTVALEIQSSDGVRKGTITVNAGGAGTVQLNATDGAGALLVSGMTSSVWASTTPFRLAMWYDPRTGEVRFYLFAGSTTTTHIFLGSRTNTAALPITTMQVFTGSAATGNATVARASAYEVRGVIHGCSVDTPHNAFDMSPGKFTTQSGYNNSADALALRLWGQREGIVNVAHGGWTYLQMRDGDPSVAAESNATWANMVTALKPQFVILGSGINSVSAAAQLAPPSTAATAKLDEAKQAGLDMINASIAAGVRLIVVRNCSPVGGHVSFPTSAQLDLVDNWNAWVATLPALYPGKVVVSDVWSKLVDPNVPRTMLPRYDVGDHIHYTVAGGEAVADADAAAILGR